MKDSRVCGNGDTWHWPARLGSDARMVGAEELDAYFETGLLESSSPLSENARQAVGVGQGVHGRIEMLKRISVNPNDDDLGAGRQDKVRGLNAHGGGHF